MSAKVKFSDNSSISSSPVKSGKYKSFLASILTPSHAQKWLKKSKNKKNLESAESVNSNAEEIYKDLQASDNFSEPGYSSIQDLRSKHSSHEKPSIKLALNSDDRQSESSQEYIQQLEYYHSKPNSNSSITDEPLYATVNKKKKNQTIGQDSVQIFSGSQLSPGEEIYPQNATASSSNTEISPSEKIIEEQKEEIKLLVERLREVTDENRDLRKNLDTVMREEKWKEDAVHAELKLKITQLDAETHKKVMCLSEQIQALQTERKVLTHQIQLLHEEKKSLQQRFEELYSKAQTMVSPDFLQKTLEDNEKLVKQLKKKHESEIKKLKDQNEVTTEANTSLAIEVDSLNERIKELLAKNESLMSSEEALLQEKSRIQLQLEESNQMQQEAQNMLISLLKITENISTERDILLNKASYQDHQQKLLQTSIVDYSLNMGRLQEHISNLNKVKFEELQHLKSGEFQRDENMKSFYGKQLDLLQSKVLNQSDTINDLQSEKSKLELQLESVWQAACLGKPQLLEEIKYGLH